MYNPSGPNNPNDGKSELCQRMDNWDAVIDRHYSDWKKEAELAYDMAAGEQWTKEAKAELEDNIVAPITINRIDPVIDAVQGAEIQNRNKIKYFPVEMGDVAVNDFLTSSADWMRDQTNASDEETDAFRDLVICGMGWVNHYMDYDSDPRGEFVMERTDPLEMGHVPTRSKSVDKSKCIRRQRRYYTEEFKDEFPHWADYVTGHDNGSDMKGHGYSTAGDDYRLEAAEAGDSYEDAMCVVSEYQWYDYVRIYHVLDPSTMSVQQISEEQYVSLKNMLRERGEAAYLENAVLRKQKVFWRAFRVGDHVVDMHRNDKEEFTYKCMTGKRDRNKNTFYGMVKAMVDPQRWANKWMTQILNIINKNAKGGLMAETDAFADPKQAEDEWARADSFTMMKPGAIGGNKTKSKPPIPYPDGLDRLMNTATDSIRQVVGMNQELMGQADRTQPGIVEAQRREAGYTVLATYFNSLRSYRKSSGELMLKYMQHLADGRLVEVTGESGGKKFVPFVRDVLNHKYQVSVDEAPDGPHQKDKTWRTIMEMIPFLKDLGVPSAVWLEAAKHSPLPASFIQKVTDMVSQPPSPEQQAAQQKQEQQADQMFQATMAKLTTDIEQMRAEIGETHADALLKQVKARQEEVDTQLKQRAMAAPQIYDARVVTG